MILLRNQINYTGLENPDVMFIVSNDGLQKVKNRITSNTHVFIDEKLEVDIENYTKGSFFKNGGKKGAALSAVSHWMRESGALPIESLLKVVENHKHAASLIDAINSAEKLQ